MIPMIPEAAFAASPIAMIDVVSERHACRQSSNPCIIALVTSSLEPPNASIAASATAKPADAAEPTSLRIEIAPFWASDSLSQEPICALIFSMSSSLRPFFLASKRTCLVISSLSCWSKAISCELRTILSPFEARMVLRAARISWIFLICKSIALDSSLPSTPTPATDLLRFCSSRTLSCLSKVCVSVCMSLISCSVTCVICCFIARTLL